MPLMAWPFFKEMKKTLVITIISICLLICSCQTPVLESAVQSQPAVPEPAVQEPVAQEPVVQAPVRTIDSAHFSSFGFEFDLEVTGPGQISVTYPSILSSELMSDYALFFARTAFFGSADVNSQSNILTVSYRDDLTDEMIKDFVSAFTFGSSSFESYLNSIFDSLEAPVYTLDVDGYVLSIKQVGNSEIIVDFPGIPTPDAALAVLQTASEVSPVSLDGADIYMSSGNRVLYIVPAVFDADEFKTVTESMTVSETAEEAQVSAPAVTSEPVSVIQIPTIQTEQPAPAQSASPTSPTSATSPAVSASPDAPAASATQDAPSETVVLSPGLVMLIIVMAIVIVTCVVALVKRKRK